MISIRLRGVATTLAAAGLVALLSACETAAQASAQGAATVSTPAAETQAPLPNGLAAEREVEAAAVVEAARIAAEQEAARVAAEQEAARVSAEQEAARVATEKPVQQRVPRAPAGSSGDVAPPEEPTECIGGPCLFWTDPVTGEHMWGGKYTAGPMVHVVDGVCWLEGTTYYGSYTAIWDDGFSTRIQRPLMGYPLRTFSVAWADYAYGSAVGGRVHGGSVEIPCPLPPGY